MTDDELRQRIKAVLDVGVIGRYGLGMPDWGVVIDGPLEITIEAEPPTAAEAIAQAEAAFAGEPVGPELSECLPACPRCGKPSRYHVEHRGGDFPCVLW